MDLLVLLPLFLQEVFTHDPVVHGRHFPRLTNLDNIKPEGKPDAIYKPRSKLECASLCARDGACVAAMHHGGQCSIYRSPISPSSVSLAGARVFVKQVLHEYLGCYDNCGPIKQRQSFDTELTPNFCMLICYGNGSCYTAMGFGNWCYCVDHPPAAYRKVADAKCNEPCTGDTSKLCGGSQSFAVFKIE